MNHLTSRTSKRGLLIERTVSHEYGSMKKGNLFESSVSRSSIINWGAGRGLPHVCFVSPHSHFEICFPASRDVSQLELVLSDHKPQALHLAGRKKTSSSVRCSIVFNCFCFLSDDPSVLYGWSVLWLEVGYPSPMSSSSGWRYAGPKDRFPFQSHSTSHGLERLRPVLAALGENE